MAIKDAYEALFVKPVSDYIKTNPQEVIDYLNKHPDKIYITERDVDIDDVLRKIKEPEYLSRNVEIKENEIIFDGIDQETVEFLVQHMSKDITEIELPNIFFKDVSFLAQFPKLEKLRIRGFCKFDEQEINFIKENTSIKEIETTNGLITDYNYKPKEGEILMRSPSEVFISGNLINRNVSNRITYNSVEVIIPGDLDFDLLERAYQIAIKSDKPIRRVEVKSISLKDEPLSNQRLLVLKINEQGEIDELIYNGKKDVSKLAPIVQKIEKTSKIHQINLLCDNKSYDKLHYLNSLAKKYDLKIDYGESNICTLEEFTAMRETLDWFSELVRENNLSPAEITTYAYDIMKTFEYKENEENKRIPRTLHSIVMSDYIVCVGYAEFMKQILRENNIPAEKVSATCNVGTEDEGGHARTLVKIDDDKYDIHGVFCIDATWDRSRGNAFLVENVEGKKYVKYATDEGDTIEREFDPLGLYRNFLIPALEYQKVYPRDTQPALFRATTEGRIKDFINPTKEVKNAEGITIAQLTSLFGTNPEQTEVEEYMYAKKPSLETLKNILYNVRISQGYSKEEALKNVTDNIELNQMIDEYNKAEPTFFQSSQRK